MQGNALGRIDSTFFTKEALAVDAMLRARPHAMVSELATSISSFGAYALTNNFTYVEEGIPFLRCADIKSGFVSFANCLFIDKEAHKFLPKSAVEPGTVLLSMSGSVGNAAVALPSWNYPINSNQDVAKIRVANVDPYYLAGFFGSCYGQIQMTRLPVGSVQQHIFLSMIGTLLVARLGSQVESGISDLMKRAYLARDVSVTMQTGAEEALLEALGLQDWLPPEPLTYSRLASDVTHAGRLDAQYFAPHHYDIIEKLEATQSIKTLGSLASLVVRGRQPEYAGAGLPVINSRHVLRNQVVLDDENRRANANGLLIQAGDLLINGTGVGTIARAAPYLNKEPAVPDNHVTIVRPKTIDPVYLSVYINSAIGQSQLTRMIKGSSGQIELYPNDIASCLVWLAPSSTQTEVGGQMRGAFAARARSRVLLAAATRAVEIAVEEGESAALTYLVQTQEADNAAAT